MRPLGVPTEAVLTDRWNRVKVLGILQTLAENFVRKASQMKGMPEHIVNNSGGKIFTFGSYRLGAYGPGSDIDTLLVAPNHIMRENFFALVPGMLAELDPPAEEVSPVPDAFMPIIKFELQNISIDLIFARIPSLASIPREMTLEKKDLLKGCDEPNLRGLNGVRLTDELLALVPHPSNFRMALRAIKLWAKSMLPMLSARDFLTCDRSRYLCQCYRISRRHCVGYDGCQDLPAVSDGRQRNYCRQVLRDLY